MAAIAGELLTGNHDDALLDEDMLDAAVSFFQQALGSKTTSVDPKGLRAEIFRDLVRSVIESTVGELPTEWPTNSFPASLAQRKTATETWAGLRANPGAEAAIVELAAEADQLFHTSVVLDWHPALEGVDVTSGIESLALHRVHRLMETAEWSEARALATARMASSWWAQPNRLAHDDFPTRWRAVRALAELNEEMGRAIPPLPSMQTMLDWYETNGWRVDAAYRKCELLRVTSGTDLDEFDEHFVASRLRYEDWLDQVLSASANAVAADPHVPEDRQQRSIHHREVRGRSDTAYVLVDALRYELGADLASRLSRLNANVDLVSAVAAVPTITAVGMSAVTPGADLRFEVALGDDSRLTVHVDGQQVRSVADRIKRFEHAHGTVADIPLDKLAQASNKELKKQIDGAALLVVRSTEIDTDGESDQLAASWGSFDATLEVLHTAIARLLHAGLKRVVITADHGFLALRRIGDERRINKPSSGAGELHRRAWIGSGGTATPSTVKVPLSDFGIGGDLDIIAPRGLGVFTVSGGLQFFHGGLSPQEIIVPVIIVTSDEPTTEPKYEIQLSVAGGRISTGVVAVTIQMTGDLFTSDSRVRLALNQDGKRVARIVGGDGYDPTTETIEAAVDKSRVIMLQISENLLSGSTATLEVLDASTGVRLGKEFAVEVAADVIVEDEL